MNASRLALSLASLAGLLVACAGAPSTQPVTPASIQPPSDAKLFPETSAKGAQVYQCEQKADSTYGWVFKAPDATLATVSGAPAGKHYAGPTWEAPDGSKVVAAAVASDPGPSPSAIPWLLLAAKSHAGKGVFADVRFIQRVRTTGGIAPTGACTASNLKSEARVPYTATYLFFR